MNIQKSFDALAVLAPKVHSGLITLEADVETKHNTAANFGAKLYSVLGNPATGDAGTQVAYNSAKSALGQKRQAYKLAMGQGRNTVFASLSLLRPLLGARWNAQWQAAGFSSGSLAQPKNPLPALWELAGYLRANPDKEIAGRSFTAAAVDQAIGAITTAQNAVQAASAAKAQAKQARDASLIALYHGVLKVRRELRDLLAADDSRWYSYGLPRPVDGQIPSRLSGLTLRPGGAGEVIASWTRSRLAENYRVRVQQEGAEGPVEAAYGPVAEAVISGLRAGSKVTVYVSAVNQSGETLAAKAEITLAA